MSTTKKPGKLGSRAAAFSSGSVPAAFAYTINDTKKIGTKKFASKNKYIKKDIEIDVAKNDSDLEGLGDVIQKVKKEDVQVPAGAIRKHKMIRQLSIRNTNEAEEKEENESDDMNAIGGSSSRITTTKIGSKKFTSPLMRTNAGNSRTKSPTRKKVDIFAMMDDAIESGPTEEARQKALEKKAAAEAPLPKVPAWKARMKAQGKELKETDEPEKTTSKAPPKKWKSSFDAKPSGGFVSPLAKKSVTTKPSKASSVVSPKISEESTDGDETEAHPLSAAEVSSSSQSLNRSLSLKRAPTRSLSPKASPRRGKTNILASLDDAIESGPTKEAKHKALEEKAAAEAPIPAKPAAVPAWKARLKPQANESKGSEPVSPKTVEQPKLKTVSSPSKSPKKWKTNIEKASLKPTPANLHSSSDHEKKDVKKAKSESAKEEVETTKQESEEVKEEPKSAPPVTMNGNSPSSSHNNVVKPAQPYHVNLSDSDDSSDDSSVEAKPKRKVVKSTPALSSQKNNFDGSSIDSNDSSSQVSGTVSGAQAGIDDRLFSPESFIKPGIFDSLEISRRMNDVDIDEEIEEIILDPQSPDYMQQLKDKIVETEKRIGKVGAERAKVLGELQETMSLEKVKLSSAFQKKIWKQRKINEKQEELMEDALEDEKEIVDGLRAENKRLRATTEKLPKQIKEVKISNKGLEKANEDVAGHFESLNKHAKKLQVDFERLDKSNTECKDKYLPRYRGELRDREQHIKVETKMKNLYRDCMIKIAKNVEKSSRSAELVVAVNQLVLETDAEVNPKFDPKFLFQDDDSSSNGNDSDDDSGSGSSSSGSSSDSD